MNNFFETNLQALQKVDPILSAKLRLVKPNERFETFTDQDPVNINIINKERHQPLYTSKPVDETLAKVEAFTEFSCYPYLYFYGMGNGIFYKVMLENPSLKRVVVIEPEPEILFIALHFADFSKEIAEKRLVVMLSADLNTPKALNLISYQDAGIFSKLYDLHILTPYYNAYADDFLTVNKIFIRAIEHSIVSLGNDSKDALLGLEHHIKNLPDIVKSPYLLEFVQKAANTDTAIIVSTGPSLHKQLPLLKELAPYVTMLCIDASFPILYQHGIRPDIVLSLERVKESAKFYKETPADGHEGVVFALTSIVHEELKSAIQGGVKQFSLRPFGYTNFFEMIPYGYMGIGMSAANMAYELVVHSRFKRCVFIGQDLAFGKDGTSHSKGAVYGEREIVPRPDDKLGESVMVEKYGGGGEVKSNTIWRMFLNFFERDIAETPYDLEVINCTEGGARIHGTKEMPFSELAKLIDKSQPKAPITLTYPEESSSKEMLEKARGKILELLKFGYEKKAIVEKVFLELVKMTETLEFLNREQRLEEIDFEAIAKLIDEIDEIKKYFEDPIFINIFYDSLQSYIIHQELDIAKIVARLAATDIDKKAKQIDWLYAHKYWLFSLAGGMDAVLEIVKRGAKGWMDIPAEFEESPQESKGEISK